MRNAAKGETANKGVNSKFVTQDWVETKTTTRPPIDLPSTED